MDGIEIQGYCYRLHFDLSAALKDSFHMGYNVFDIVSKYGDVLLDNGNFYIWLLDEPKENKLKMLRALKKLGVKEIYCEEINLKQVQDESTLLSSWFFEHYGPVERRLFEKNNQKALRECLLRIENSKQKLKQEKGVGYGGE